MLCVSQRDLLVGRAVTLTVPMDPHGFGCLFLESVSSRIEATLEWLEARLRVLDFPPQLVDAWHGHAGMEFPLKPIRNGSNNLLQVYGDVRCRYHLTQLPYMLSVHFRYRVLVRDISRSTATKEVWLDELTRQVCLEVDKEEEARRKAELSDHAPLVMYRKQVPTK
jgi:hypothetical protein